MGNISIEQLGPLLKERRGSRGIREVAAVIGISPATLSRIETGKQPDLGTFSKVCQWLGLDAGEVLGCALPRSSAQGYSLGSSAAHFRADKAMSPDTARHLSELILSVQRAIENELSSQR